jgi:PEGA domain
LKNPGLIAASILALALSSFSQTQADDPSQPSPPPAAASSPTGPALQDGTPIKLRMGTTVSSADAHVGDQIDLEVLEEIRVGNTVVVAKGGTAMASVTTAQTKKNMGRGGKLDINIDYVKLVDGEKASLRAVKDMKGGGHQGAMTGAIVATSLVFFPAAPLFLFVHGKDISIPKGTEVTAFVSGDMPLDLAKFQTAPSVGSTAVASNAATDLEIISTPNGGEISIDGNFVGNAPSTINISAGQHSISVRMSGYQEWQRTIRTSGGKVKLTATLTAADTQTPISNTISNCSESASCEQSVADAARAAKAKQN